MKKQLKEFKSHFAFVNGTEAFSQKENIKAPIGWVGDEEPFVSGYREEKETIKTKPTGWNDSEEPFIGGGLVNEDGVEWSDDDPFVGGITGVMNEEDPIGWTNEEPYLGEESSVAGIGGFNGPLGKTNNEFKNKVKEMKKISKLYEEAIDKHEISITLHNAALVCKKQGLDKLANNLIKIQSYLEKEILK